MGVRSVWCAPVCACAVFVMAGCPGEEEEPVGEVLTVELASEHTAVVPTSVVSVRLVGTSRLVATSALVDVEGQVGGSAIDYTFVAQEELGEQDATLARADGDTGDLVVRVPVSEGLWSELVAGATFEGAVSVTARDPFGRDLAKGTLAGVRWDVQENPSPTIASAPSGDVWAGERVAVTGGPFLRPEEGLSWAVVTTGAIGGRSMDGVLVPLEWGGARDRASFVIAPEAFGVAEAVFEGDFELLNVLEGGREVRGDSLSGVRLSLQRSFVSRLSKGSASRGERVGINGRGLIESKGGAGMTLRLEGTFTPTGGAPIDLFGDAVLERAPDRFVGDELVELEVWYDVDDSSWPPRLTGLGATPGVFEGRITPRLFDPLGGQQLGIPWEGVFEVKPTVQVVYLKYLPRFSTGLEKYGLRNVEADLRAKIREVAQAPYAEVAVVFVDEPPADFADFATVELSGPDPYGSGAFGYDNSFNGYAKDTGNIFLSDYIGGWNYQSQSEFANPFGGIYIESFDYFSPTLTGATDSSPEFDRILGPFMPELDGEPVLATEWPSGPRAAQIQEAIDMVGNVVGNTVAHEVGHSMGLSYFPADWDRPGDAFHNRTPTDGALMDAGGGRPFAERAAIGGTAPARFNERNLEYLKGILPKR